MRIDFQFIDMATSDSLQVYTQNKLQKLAKKYDYLISATVLFKKEVDLKGKGKVCDIELSLTGPRIHASSNEKNYELAVKETLKDAEKQLEKHKATMKPYL